MSSKVLRVGLVLRASDQFGGLEKIVEHAIKATYRNKVEFSIIVLGARDADSRYRELGASTVDFARSGWAARKLLRGLDVVHLHAPTLTGWSAPLLAYAKARRIPAVLTIHLPGVPEPKGIKRAVKVRTLGLALRIASPRVLAPSDAAARMAQRRLGWGLSCGVLIQGVPDPGHTAAEPSGPVRLSFVGRLVEQKDPRALLDIMEELQRTGLPARLDIVGDGPLLDELVARARSGRLDVRFHGYQEDAIPFIREADLLVLTSHAEGCPVVVMEAAALGRATVAFDGIEGVDEILPHAYFPVTQRSAEAFSSVIQQAMVNNDIARIGEAARAAYEANFSMGAAALRYEACYEAVVRGSSNAVTSPS